MLHNGPPGYGDLEDNHDVTASAAKNSGKDSATWLLKVHVNEVVEHRTEVPITPDVLEVRFQSRRRLNQDPALPLPVRQG